MSFISISSNKSFAYPFLFGFYSSEALNRHSWDQEWSENTGDKMKFAGQGFMRHTRARFVNRPKNGGMKVPVTISSYEATVTIMVGKVGRETKET